jgi:hypothetical protein
MADDQIAATYSDTALQGIVRDLSRSRSWPSRLRAAQLELSRRKANPNHSPKDTTP